MALANVTFEQATTRFWIDNADDHIQAHHVRGKFYEMRQLLIHSDMIPMRGTVIDVGANVGNHTLFYAKHTWAGRIYPFEPNPRACRLLEQNIAKNDGYHAEIDLSHVALAAGAVSGQLAIAESQPNNLGGTQMTPGEGEVVCAKLDDLVFEGQVSFVKIDVEGMEIDVLAGAQQLIMKFRPCIAIEIAQRQEPLFWTWTRENQYHVVNASCDYLHYKNYVMIPTW